MASSVPAMSRQAILLHGPRLRRWILAAVVAGVPIIFLRFTNDPFNVPKLGLLVAGIGLVTAIRLSELIQGAEYAGLTRLVIPVSSLGLPLLLAWVLSPYRSWALFGEYQRFQGLLPYVCVLLLGLLVADTFVGEVRLLALALSAAGAVAGGYAVVQFIGLDPFQWAQQFGGEATRTSTLGNSNFTGGFLAIVAPVSLSLAFVERERKRRAWQLFALIVAGLILSFSQGALVALVAGLAIVGGFYLAPRWKSAKLLSLLVAAGAAAASVGIILIAVVRPDTGRIPETIELRAKWWRAAASMAADYPVIGRGPNAYAVDRTRYRVPEEAARQGFDTANDPHSVPLSILTSSGAVGLLGFLIVFAWAIKLGLTNPPGASLATGFFAAIVAYLVQSLASIDELSLRVALWTCIGGLSAAMATAVDSDRKSQAKQRPVKKKRKSTPAEPIRALPAVILLTIAALATVWWGARFISSDAAVQDGIVAYRGGDAEQGSGDFAKAIGFRDDYEYRHIDGFYLGESAVGLEEEEEDGSRLLTMALDRYSYLDGFASAAHQRDLAKMLAAYSAHDRSFADDAATAYGEAVSLDPYNATLLAEAAPVLAADDRFETLVEALGNKMEVVGEHAPTLWGYLAWAYVELGNEAEAENALAQAVQADPENEAVVRAQRLLAD